MRKVQESLSRQEKVVEAQGVVHGRKTLPVQ